MHICSHCNIDTILFMENFSRCPKCELVYYLDAQAVEYEDNYFETEYQNQYGTNYIDDKNKIQNRMKERIEKLTCYLQNLQGKKILELGSAAGFFLELMQKEGCEVTGWEKSSYMNSKAKESGLNSLCGDIFTLYNDWKNENASGFDVVAAFYVIEHIKDQKSLWKMLASLVNNDGYLLIATPSLFGPMYKFFKKKWASTHPRDHFVDYSLRSLKKVARMYNFKVISTSAEGIHPHRMPLGKFWPLTSFYTALQKKLSFSDTVFVILKYQGEIQ